MLDRVSELYSEFIYKRTYSRYLPDLKRRETWEETVDRYITFFVTRFPKHQKFLEGVIRDAILAKEVMPSMRCLWSAGVPLEQENITGYNCSYVAVDSPDVLSEILYILMCGAGVGFSTERQFISKLPEVPLMLVDSGQTLAFADSRIGWAEGYREFINGLYRGVMVKCDLAAIRSKGTPLKTFGGRASGPEPLDLLLRFTRQTFAAARGRRLNSIEVYDIVCMIANCVVSGGVRRSSTMNLSNLSDSRMKGAKVGAFYQEHPYRGLSNNSVAYTEKPDMATFVDEWTALMRNGTGERGIFVRPNSRASSPKRAAYPDFGTNPCGEIVLRSKQFCNLTEVIVRPMDTFYALNKKVEIATFLGLLQSQLTEFKFLSPEWKTNCEEERLLGVSLTGLRDHWLLGKNTKNAADALDSLRAMANATAEYYKEGNSPAAIACVKPSGTVSQFVGCSSGMHVRYSPYYIRRVRVASTDPVARMLKDNGVPCSPETGQTWEDCSTVVFEFPMASPEGAACREAVTALDQLEYWAMLKTHWTDHNPSCTIYVREHEWLEVGAWVYKNWEIIGGLSFLPYDGGVYELPPYEEITKDEYLRLSEAFPSVDFSRLQGYEEGDHTEGAKEYACTGSSCEI